MTTNFTGSIPTNAYESNSMVLTAYMSTYTPVSRSVVSANVTVAPTSVDVRPSSGQQYPRFA